MIFGETSRRIYLTSRSPIKEKKNARLRGKDGDIQDQ